MKKIAICLVVLFWTLASFTVGVEYQRGDVDQDGQVGISDVTCLIDYILNGSWEDEPPVVEHEYVDLGLPSGTLWATCNVGANTPEEYGDYFAWGETVPKDYYDWNTYKWCNGNEYTLTKYSTDSNYGYNGFVDNKTELDTYDDAAYVNWGPSWRMPTTEQQRELYEKCSSVWTTQNGVNGLLFTGPNGNTLFLSAASYRYFQWHYGVGSYGDYWSRTLDTDYPNDAYDLYFSSESVNRGSACRVYGRAVRAVRVSQN